MVQYCFMSTETIRLIRTESPGQPPWLSHSSWILHIMCRDHRIYVLLRSRQTSICDFIYLSLAETTRFLHPPEKQEDRCLWLQLYNDFSYISVAETTRCLHPPEKQVDRCLRLQLSIYPVTLVICLYCDFSYLPMQSLIYLCCDFSYLPIQWLQLSTYTVTSVIYLCCDFSYTVYIILVSVYSRDHKISMSSWKAYSCLRLQLFICNRDHKISTSFWEAGRQVSVTSVIYLCSNFSYLSMLWFQLSTNTVTSVICLCCDFSYLPIQSLQLSIYTVTSVIYLYSDFSYAVTSVICIRDQTGCWITRPH